MNEEKDRLRRGRGNETFTEDVEFHRTFLDPMFFRLDDWLRCIGVAGKGRAG